MIFDELSIDDYNQEVAAKKKTTWGGKRLRAGRKPTLKDPVGFALEIEKPEMDVLRGIAKERGVSVASLVRRAVSAYVKRQKKG